MSTAGSKVKDRDGGVVLSHSKRKERVLSGAQSIEGEPGVKELGRATGRCFKVTK